jgi:hypothetical protein
MLNYYRLDLTTASRVYLMEPQWNPTIEEQALARVHRLGQTKKVTTVRFIMKDSVEDVSCPINSQAFYRQLLARYQHPEPKKASSRPATIPAAALTA